jgi:PEGA domain-containing protein
MRPHVSHSRVIGWSAVFALGLAGGAFAVWILDEPASPVRSDAAASATAAATTGAGAPPTSAATEPQATVGRVPTVGSTERSVPRADSRQRPAVASRRVASSANDRAAARLSGRRTQRSSDVAAASATVPQAPSRGALTVDSVPQGARLSLDGRPVGSTPIVLRNVPAGTHLVRLEADGYHVWAWTAQVVAHQQRTLTVRLFAAPTRSALTTPDKALK